MCRLAPCQELSKVAKRVIDARASIRWQWAYGSLLGFWQRCYLNFFQLVRSHSCKRVSQLALPYEADTDQFFTILLVMIVRFWVLRLLCPYSCCPRPNRWDWSLLQSRKGRSMTRYVVDPTLSLCTDATPDQRMHAFLPVVHSTYRLLLAGSLPHMRRILPNTTQAHATILHEPEGRSQDFQILRRLVTTAWQLQKL